ncbi:tRNA (adenosine(37)-N6)-threonylcarbamoyltransferase complex ATPase subunit type 1 TsaE [Polaromonas vacuolata]|nr:tRNA (adenosine(37)-N6)-threonylcarbamoyltransferase complex ATPase subunit type 1 TsaE [Polaromonas vacuolata]
MMTDMDHPLIVKTIVWPDETGCEAFAQSLALKPVLGQAMLELHGDLGAGKTTFVRYLLKALGVQGRIKSPTYAVVEPYSLESISSGRDLNIWHFDFYRFNDPDEWEDAGFREIFASTGLKLVEWPENAGPYLPRADMQIKIQTNDDESRSVTLSALTATGQALLS